MIAEATISIETTESGGIHMTTRAEIVMVASVARLIETMDSGGMHMAT